MILLKLLHFLGLYWHNDAWLKHDMPAQRKNFINAIQEHNKKIGE